MWDIVCQPGCVHHLGKREKGCGACDEWDSGIHLWLPWAGHPGTEYGYRVSESGPLGTVLSFCWSVWWMHISSSCLSLCLYSSCVPDRTILPFDEMFLSSFSCGAHCRCLLHPADKRTKRSTGREQNAARKVVYMHLQCPSAVSSPSWLLQGNSWNHFWCSGISGILQQRSQPYLYLDPSSSWVLSLSPGACGQPCCLWFEGKVVIFPELTEDSCNICWYLTKSYTEGIPHASHCLCCGTKQRHSTLWADVTSVCQGNFSAQVSISLTAERTDRK